MLELDSYPVYVPLFTAANARRNRVLPQGDTKYLRQWLRLLFYPAIRIRGKSCVFNFVYVLIFLLQLTKLVLVTTQVCFISVLFILHFNPLPDDKF